MSTIILGRGGRRAAVLLVAALALLATASPALACLDVCIETYGAVYYEKSIGRYVELDYCTQRYNDAGGVTTMCYYSTF
jgi:hypothetical protein